MGEMGESAMASIQIQNPKFEIRNKSETPISNVENVAGLSTFEHSYFEFV